MYKSNIYTTASIFLLFGPAKFHSDQLSLLKLVLSLKVCPLLCVIAKCLYWHWGQLILRTCSRTGTAWLTRPHICTSGKFEAPLVSLKTVSLYICSQATYRKTVKTKKAHCNCLISVYSLSASNQRLPRSTTERLENLQF
jgi:hypothetical protein